MISELSNLSLFFLAIAKAGVLTGILPGILIVYVAETWASAFRVPARKLFGKVVSDESHRDQGRERDGRNYAGTGAPGRSRAGEPDERLRGCVSDDRPACADAGAGRAASAIAETSDQRLSEKGTLLRIA